MIRTRNKEETLKLVMIERANIFVLLMKNGMVRDIYLIYPPILPLKVYV